jgi:parvulin-like peptidyl-prolyl isomerase
MHCHHARGTLIRDIDDASLKRRFIVRDFITAVLLVCMVFLPMIAESGELGVAATVNGVEISRHRLQKSFEGYLDQRQINVAAIRSPDNYKAMKKEVLDILIGQELLWQDAVDRQLITTEKEVNQALSSVQSEYSSEDSFQMKLENSGFTKAEFREDMKRRLSVQRLISSHISKEVLVTDKEVEKYFNSNKEMFVIPEQVHVRHILIKVNQDASDATREIARKHITDILAKIRDDGSNFAELAIQYSEDSSNEDGGDLGVSPRGRFVPAFEQVAFSLQLSEISSIVETPFGYHIIKLENRQDRTLPPIEVVRLQIGDYLMQPRIQQAVEKYTEKLYDQGQIKILEHL